MQTGMRSEGYGQQAECTCASIAEELVGLDLVVKASITVSASNNNRSIFVTFPLHPEYLPITAVCCLASGINADLKP